MTEPESAESSDAERIRRADRATRGGLAGLLGLEAFVVLLVPRAIAQTSSGLSGTKTGLLLGLAVLLLAGAFLLRRRWGIGAGSVLQLLVIGTVLLIPIIAIVVVFFLLLWWYLLRTRHQLLATPAGWRMLIS
jgi:MYXO-CTERM domain-containing protein